MEDLADRIKRIEEKMDLLVTKVDLLTNLILTKGKKVHATKTRAKAASDSEGSYMDTSSSSSDEEVTVTNKKLYVAADNCSAKEPTKKPAANTNLEDESYGGNGQTISVKGIDSSLHVDDIRNALTKLFGSFGKITRLFVPTDRETGLSLGYAYIDLTEGAEKALELGTVNVGGKLAVVDKAEPKRIGSTWPYPGRCGNLGRCSFC